VKVWDPATGQELRTLQGQRRFQCVAFSPDGSRIAAGCQDDPITEDLTLKVWDARPTIAERDAEREALAVLDFLFALPLRRGDVREHLRGPAVLSSPARAQALALAERYPARTDAERFYRASWAVLCRPRLNAVQYRFARRQAEAARCLGPGPTCYQVALGAAAYRTGRYREALAALSPAGSLPPAGQAFRAMAQHRLGQPEQARATLACLREVAATRPGGQGRGGRGRARRSRGAGRRHGGPAPLTALVSYGTPPLVRLKAVCSSRDWGEPVVTVMLPAEVTSAPGTGPGGPRWPAGSAASRYRTG
jgi:hypothetical protein